MTVFFNVIIKFATKRLLAYRYGARKENLTFFQHYSLNRGFHSLYGVKEEKFLKKMSENRVEWTVFYEKRKTISNLYPNR